MVRALASAPVTLLPCMRYTPWLAWQPVSGMSFAAQRLASCKSHAAICLGGPEVQHSCPDDPLCDRGLCSSYTWLRTVTTSITTASSLTLVLIQSHGAGSQPEPVWRPGLVLPRHIPGARLGWGPGASRPGRGRGCLGSTTGHPGSPACPPGGLLWPAAK